MLWFLLVVLAVTAVLPLSLLAALFLSASAGDSESEQARVGRRVRQAERQLHDVARDGFVAMLEEARSRGGAS